MRYQFTKRVTDVPNSGIGFMMRYAAKYTDVVSLGQGTPLFPTPSFIYDELYKRSKTNPEIGMYSSSNIEKELKNQIAIHMNQLYGFTPDDGTIYLTMGGIAGLFSALMSLLEEDDEIIYFDPSYPLHLSQIHICQAKPVFVSYREDKGWSLDFEKLKQSISPKTKAILLTNPNNPTGMVLTEEEVIQLADIVSEHNLILILDEAYEFLTYDKPLFSPLRIEKIRDNTIVCKSFSKEFAMTGWRIGYVYAQKDIIAKINDIHTHLSISPPTPSIVAATIAMSDPRGKLAMEEFKVKFRESRQAICSRLDKLPKLFSYNKPDGAYYAFPKFLNFDLSSFDFAKLLIDEAKVITIPGSTMGPSGEGHIRMSFAADSAVINNAFDRIDTFARKHNLY